MAFFNGLFGAFGKKSGKTLDQIRKEIAESIGGGVNITHQKALQISAVSACVRVIGEGIAQVPLKLMQSSDNKTRLPAKSHPLYDVLAMKPNDWQTSFEYREQIAMHAVLCGNHYSFINRSKNYGVLELIPFEPGSVEVIRDSKRNLSYKVSSENGNTQVFPAESIWHIRGPSWNGWQGLDAVKLARQSMGLSLSIERQQTEMQKNGVQTSGIYSVDGVLKDDQYKKLKGWIDENIAGSKNAGNVMVLDRNAKYMQTSMTSVDAQTLETRRYQVEEICRFTRVNPIMVGAESKNTTYASAEQMFLAHVVHCLSPWYTRLEQSIDTNLLTKEERAKGLYSAFIDDGLLRGSMMNRKDVILGYVNGGLMYPNEGRALLDLNPDPDPLSNQLRVPANITGNIEQEKEDDTTEA